MKLGTGRSLAGMSSIGENDTTGRARIAKCKRICPVMLRHAGAVGAAPAMPYPLLQYSNSNRASGQTLERERAIAASSGFDFNHRSFIMHYYKGVFGLSEIL